MGDYSVDRDAKITFFMDEATENEGEQLPMGNRNMFGDEREPRNGSMEIGYSQKEAKRRAEEAKRRAEEAKRKAEEATCKAEEAKRRAEEAKRKADEATSEAEEAKCKAEEEAKRMVDEATRKAEEEAKRKVEEATRKAEEEKAEREEVEHRAEEAKTKADEEAKRKVEEATRKAEEEKAKTEDEATRKEEEAKKKAEKAQNEAEEATRKAEEAKNKAEEAKNKATEEKAWNEQVDKWEKKDIRRVARSRGIITWANLAIAVICLLLFGFFMVAGTCSLCEYKGAVTRKIQLQESITREVMNSIKSTVPQLWEKNAPVKNTKDYISKLKTLPENQESFDQFLDNVQTYMQLQNNDDTSNETSMELKNDSFSITANNAIVIIVFQYVLAIVFLILCIKYYTVKI